jgi:hypothetical protein
MTDLYHMEVTEECVVYVWKGVPADPKKQRPMFNWYEHCSNLGALKLIDKGLYNQRMKTINKWFSTKDSSYANIYRHYHEVARW